jgi:hypothetical protein
VSFSGFIYLLDDETILVMAGMNPAMTNQIKTLDFS